MKKNIALFVTIPFYFLILSSCSGLSPNETKNAVDSNSIKKIEIKEANIIPQILLVKFFTKIEEYDQDVLVKGKTFERVEFQEKKIYSFMPNIEEFSSLQISGRGKNYSIEIMGEKKMVFKKQNFEIVNEIVFSKKDFDFKEDGGPYTITIKQNENEVFKGKILIDHTMSVD
jgi:hypothetical protein